MNKVKIGCLLMLMPLLVSVKAQAAIYKCVKANSDVYYNDKPCPIADDETKLNSVKDPVNGYIPPAFVEDSNQSGSIGQTVRENTANGSNQKLDSLSKSESLTRGNLGGKSSTSSTADAIGSASTIENQQSADTQSSSLGSEEESNLGKTFDNHKLNVVNLEPIKFN